MVAMIDLVGRRFGRLLVQARAPVTENRPRWLCACDCGGSTVVAGGSLRRGLTVSCGCARSDLVAAKNYRHGGRWTREYKTWQGMRRRCQNKKSPAYRYFGGRGITVCERWRDSFVRFRADMGPCPPGFTIERVNNDGDYEPANCIWASRAAQTANRRPRGSCGKKALKVAS